MANNKSGQAVSRTIPIETDCNFEKQTDNYKLQQANKFKSQQAPAPAPTSGTQNIQGDNGKQANNSGTQHQPNFAFSQTAPAPATAPATATTSGFYNNNNTGKQNNNTGNQTFDKFSF